MPILDSLSNKLKPILVLGSGQLGLMMAAEGARMGIRVDRFDLQQEKILFGTSSYGVSANIDDIQQYPIITAELEHLGHSPLLDAIYELPQWQNPKAFEILPNRTRQKQLFDLLNLPTAPWMPLNDEADLEQAHNSVNPQLVIKITEGGYDGRGQWCLFDANAVKPPVEHYGRLIAEARIDFEREVSIIGARSANGSLSFLPLTENTHHNGILRYSITRQEPESLQVNAQAMLEKLMKALDYTGVMAMECFVTGDGLLINEVAPRVHNSGHWSQLGCVHNQFSLHLSGLQNCALQTQNLSQHTLMLNLIGCEFNPDWLTIEGVQCYWYNKSVRPGRKLGHINIPADHLIINKLYPTLDEEHKNHLQQALSTLS